MLPTTQIGVTPKNLAHSRLGNPKGTNCKTRFPGIVADARALGVNRITLYRVLTGERVLRGLRARYDALKDSQIPHDPISTPR